MISPPHLTPPILARVSFPIKRPRTHRREGVATAKHAHLAPGLPLCLDTVEFAARFTRNAEEPIFIPLSPAIALIASSRCGISAKPKPLDFLSLVSQPSRVVGGPAVIVGGGAPGGRGTSGVGAPPLYGLGNDFSEAAPDDA